MPALDRDGIFKATPMEAVVRPQKEGSQAVRIGIKFEVTAMLDGSEWVDWSEYGQEVYGDFVVIKRDGAVNESAAGALRDALRWNGSLDLDGWVMPNCQIVVKPDEYQGVTRYRADWVSPIDYVPTGMGRSDDDDVKSLEARHGAKLRAFCSAGPVKTPVPPAPTTTASKPPVPPVAASAPPPPVAGKIGTTAVTTQEDAWADFEKLKAANSNITDEKLQVMWFDACNKVAPGKGGDDYTADDWAAIAAEAIPF